METIEKPWGNEELLEVNNSYVVKALFMRKGNRCSLQYHKQKRETVVVISGTLTINYKDTNSTWKDIVLNPGDFCTIAPGRIHRMAGVTDVVYIETSTPELNDVVRMEDDYGRK